MNLHKSLRIGAALALSLVILFLAFLASLPPLFGKSPAVTISPVEKSLCVLDPDGSAGILVGGDSRAMYHVIPSILEEETGLECVNLGQWIHLGGDPTSLVNALRRHPEALASKPIILLSVTIDVANDLAFKGIPLAAFFNWSIPDHLHVLWERQKAYPRFLATTVLPSLAGMLEDRIRDEEFRCGPDIHRPASLLAGKGYHAYEGRKRKLQWSLPGLEEDYILDGGNWKALQAALDWLDASPARRIILFHAPIDSTWLLGTDGPVAMGMEKRFSDMLSAEAARHSKVSLWDYHRHPLPELTDSLFYDPTHLNQEGAEILSRDLGRRLAKLDSSGNQGDR